MSKMHCIGCGGFACNMEPGQVMAIACRCGAMVPILVGDDGVTFAPPASLGAALTARKEGLHFEYYLGYSDHTSPAKEAVMKLLLEAGATSQRDCKEPGCQRAIERQERRARIAQIGEE